MHVYKLKWILSGREPRITYCLHLHSLNFTYFLLHASVPQCPKFYAPERFRKIGSRGKANVNNRKNLPKAKVYLTMQSSSVWK